MTGSNQNPTSDAWVRRDSERMLDDARREKLRRCGPALELISEQEPQNKNDNEAKQTCPPLQ
jgi:hypothetical protein